MNAPGHLDANKAVNSEASRCTSDGHPWTDFKRITSKKTIAILQTLILINIVTPQNPKIQCRSGVWVNKRLV
jgi:hypothetical protein